MDDDDSYFNIVPHLVFAANAALELRTVSGAPTSRPLPALAQQIMDAAVAFAAAVGTADTFEALDTAYRTHYGLLEGQIAQLTGCVIPPAAQAAYDALCDVWENYARREILYHCDIDALDATDDLEAGSTEEPAG